MELKFFDNISQECFSIKKFNFVPRLHPKKERKSPSPLHLIIKSKEEKLNLSDEKIYSKKKKILNIKNSKSLNIGKKLNNYKNSVNMCIIRKEIGSPNIVHKSNFSKKLIFNHLLKKKSKKIMCIKI
jgi:hypothetical protein